MVTEKQIRETAGKQIIFIISPRLSSLSNTVVKYVYNPKTDTVENYEYNDDGYVAEDEYDVTTATKYINGLLKRNDVINISHNFEKPKTVKGYRTRTPQKKCPVKVDFRKML